MRILCKKTHVYGRFNKRIAQMVLSETTFKGNTQEKGCKKNQGIEANFSIAKTYKCYISNKVIKEI